VVAVHTALGLQIIYVDSNATGANDGSSWVNAYRYLQDSLTNANSSEKPVEIRVAQGTYKPDQGAGITLGDKTATFQLINGVTLKGSYAGLGQPDPNVRNIEKYKTILSGDLAGNDLDVNDPCDLRNEASRFDNSNTVVNASGTNETAVLNGFTITAGYISFTVRNGPVGGAGMLNKSGSPTLFNCIFTGNGASYGSGAGLFNYQGSNPILVNCTFTGNYASNGGGMHNLDSAPNLTNCIFYSNYAREGGAMSNQRSSPTLSNCTFKINSAELGGGLCNEHSDKISLINCSFIGNSSGWHGGGGIASYECSLTLTNCVLSGNYSAVGGAMLNAFGELALNNCTFSGNLAQWEGGGMFNRDCNVRLTNCILWENGNEIVNAYNSMAYITYSNIQGGWSGLGEGNIDLDPCFADPGYWDPNGTPEDPNDDFWIDGDYHLKSQAGRWEPVSQSWVKDDVTSPCIDAGDPASPIGEEPFPNGGRINMGAYGGTAEASKSYFGEPICETIIAGDINGDCKVDFEDFLIMAIHWLEERQHIE
jgi:hypothetical protein